MDVPPPSGGERRGKITLFPRSTRREWQDARVAVSDLTRHMDVPAAVGRRAAWKNHAFST
jgi:hypothetical protein